jgi:hypothetical protein
MGQAKRLGSVLQWLSLFTFVGLALWLETDLFSVTGGGLILLALGGYLPTLGRVNPTWTKALSGMALLAVSMFTQNLITGLFISARLSKFDFVFLLIGSFMLAVFALALVVGQFLPTGSKPRDYPSWARKLWNLTIGVVGGTVVLVALASGIVFGGAGKIEDLGILAAAATLAASGAIGVALVSFIPPLGDNRTYRPLPRQFIAISAFMILGGIPLELLRGDWLLWSLTALALASVLAWLDWVTRAHVPKVHAIS